MPYAGGAAPEPGRIGYNVCRRKREGRMNKQKVEASPVHNGELALKRVAIDTYRENVAYLHRDCHVYRAEGFQALSKIQIRHGEHRILAVLNVVDDEAIVDPGELGLSEQAFAQFGAEAGARVSAAHAEPPRSMEAVRRKMNGEILGEADFTAIARDINDHLYSKTELAAFLVASGQTGLDRDEILYLTRAMFETGERLNWEEPLVADKHCIGGIPGNRTSMLVVPIIAAHGMLIPKTSSRAITSPSGTADTMEVLANVELSPEALYHLGHQHRGCLAWGGTAHLAPVDDILISVERPLGLDSQGLMVASILSKKLAAGSTHLLIDIPVGPTAKVRHMRQALALRKLFEFVGDHLGIHLEVVITDGRQPVGRGIGPVLEVRDVLQVLENDPDAPADLRQKSLHLAGRILEFDPDVRGGFGYAIARDILESGRALEKLQAIIAAQGAREADLEPGPLNFEIKAREDGIVTAIDNYRLGRIARLAGAPMGKGAGVDLLVKVGDRVRAGEPLYRVHAEVKADFEFARQLCERDSGYSLGDHPPPAQIEPFN
ncbi:putative thymidine phosphorylase [Thiohalobacter sp. COW1]|uniref:Putative thymidine phosphorylase n=2 Tax=Thiohalobacteraceae TaxID=3085110 RepID=A0A1Z4VUB4_9GAMM|nr:thymidine phosphorylase [Thiohalobacter thiocyanaticus]BCO33094.1 putative thymidine phosphorylase [Thiohalobacter sp. COW1]